MKLVVATREEKKNVRKFTLYKLLGRPICESLIII